MNRLNVGKKVFLLLLAIALSSCTHTPPTDPDIVKITVLHTNDVHGHLWPFKRRDGEVRGGVAALASLVDRIRNEVEKNGGYSFLLSAGDVNTGVPDSDFFKAEPDFKAMDAIGYDAMVLGNHEFDNGIETIKKQLEWSHFPIISSNITLKTGKAFVPPYVILEKGGLKVGILGATTDSLASLVLKEHSKKLGISSPISAAAQFIPEMKQKGAELIIALTHLGLTRSDKKRSVLIANDDVKLASAGLNLPLIVGGHSHALLNEGIREGETLIVQAGEKGEYLGRVDLDWSRKEKKVVKSTASVVRINPEEGEKEEIKALLKPFEEKAGQIFDEVIGQSQVDLDGETANVRTKETNLGNLISDVVRITANADAAVFNGGGIRGSIPAGPIKLRDVYRIFPFKNTIVKATFSAKQLKTLLASATKNRKQAGGSFLHVSGMSYIIKGDEVTNIRVNDTPLTDKTKVVLATNSFVMAGGDRLDIVVEPKKFTDTGIFVADALVNHLKRFRSVSPFVDGRVQILD